MAHIYGYYTLWPEFNIRIKVLMRKRFEQIINNKMLLF